MQVGRMTADEAETVQQLAQLTGRSVREIRRAIERSPDNAILFQVAVELATGEWDWLDGETGQWRTDDTMRQTKLARYAHLLTEPDPCAASSPSS